MVIIWLSLNSYCLTTLPLLLLQHSLSQLTSPPEAKTCTVHTVAYRSVGNLRPGLYSLPARWTWHLFNLVLFLKNTVYESLEIVDRSWQPAGVFDCDGLIFSVTLRMFCGRFLWNNLDLLLSHRSYLCAPYRRINLHDQGLCIGLWPC